MNQVVSLLLLLHPKNVYIQKPNSIIQPYIIKKLKQIYFTILYRKEINSTTMKYDNKRRKKSMTKKKGKGQRLSINAIDNTNKTLYVNEQTTFTCFMENLNGTTYHSKSKVPIDISLVYASNPSESSDVEYDVIENKCLDTPMFIEKLYKCHPQSRTA